MRAVLIIALLVSSCGSRPESAKPTSVEAPPKPADESRRFPKANFTGSEIVDRNLMGKPFMPGGTIAHYRQGKTQFDLFVAKAGSATEAAILLSDWRKALTNPTLVPSFGGYFGQDAGQPVFVFSKGEWVAGVEGLPQKQADLQARTLAGQL